MTAMAQAEHTVTIHRSAEEIFDYLADGTNNPHWRAGVLEIEPTGDVTGAGATYRQVLRGPGGRRIAGDYRVTTYDRPNTLAFEVIAGPARPKGIFQLAPIDATSATVTFRLSATPSGIMRLMTPMIAKQMRVETRQLDNLKARLEK
jgi:uncharacterized protein YndB with AHSA1/START domain